MFGPDVLDDARVEVLVQVTPERTSLLDEERSDLFPNACRRTVRRDHVFGARLRVGGILSESLSVQFLELVADNLRATTLLVAADDHALHSHVRRQRRLRNVVLVRVESVGGSVDDRRRNERDGCRCVLDTDRIETLPRRLEVEKSVERLLVRIAGRRHRLDGGIRDHVEPDQRRKLPIGEPVIERGVDEILRVDDQRTVEHLVVRSQRRLVDTVPEAPDRPPEGAVDLVHRRSMTPANRSTGAEDETAVSGRGVTNRLRIAVRVAVVVQGESKRTPVVLLEQRQVVGPVERRRHDRVIVAR
nr:hypothetical protein [Halovivax cerinus]